MTKSRPAVCLLTLVFVSSLFLGGVSPDALMRHAEAAETSSEETTSDTLPTPQSSGMVRPESLAEGLSRKSFEEIEGRRVTLRQPVMDVTDRNVARDETTVLSDVFRFIDPDTHEFYQGEGEEYAQIDFAAEHAKYEAQKIADGTHVKKEYPVYPKKGLDKGADFYFSNFTKYMLLRQTWYYRGHSMAPADEAGFTDEFKKHPAADGIYGGIDRSERAVSKHIVSDPVYRSPLTTGLYLPAGEVVTVTVSGLKEGQKVRLTTHQQDSLGYDGSIPDADQAAVNSDPTYKNLSSTERYFRYWDKKLIEEAVAAKKEGRSPEYDKLAFNLMPQWRDQNQKVPCMGNIYDFEHDGEYQIGSIYGGPLYLQPTDGTVDLVITGAVETPHFILGVTTKEEFETYLREAPGPIATLDVENGQLVGFSEYMAKTDDIEKVAYFWHSVFAINSSLNGRAYNYNITMAYDMHVPAGEAVALNSSFCAQPYGWFEACMNYETLTTKGNWGTFHELGHVQAKTYGVNWGMCSRCSGSGVDGEVWNNTLIILMYSMLCNMDPRVVQVEHGEFTHPFTVVDRSMKTDQNVVDYHGFNSGKSPHFDQLSLYATLIHSFGPERFVDFFYTYNVQPVYCDQPSSDPIIKSRADFIYRIGLVDHVNIFDWVNKYYHGNVTKDDFSEEQWEYLSLLPDFWPVAYRWANGIDGNETARKYDVDGKYPTVFDLSEGNIVSPEEFEIVDVTQPAHGTLVYDKTGERVTYTPPKEITEEDSFDIVVMSAGERLVTLNVNLRLNYRGTYAEVWKLNGEASAKQSVDAALEEIGVRAPDRTEESNVAGKATFQAASTEREYYHLRFRFNAAEEGLHTFYLKADDASRVDFRKDSEDANVVGTLYTTQDRPSYEQNGKVEITLKKGEAVYADCHLVNWGGKGYLYVGVKLPGTDTIVDIPASYLSNAAASDEDLAKADDFKGWQPEFLDSIKDTSFDYQPEKSNWKMLKVPTFSATSEGAKDPHNLIDGKDSTFYHTSYGNPSYDDKTNPRTHFPHEYILDCGGEESFNYFEFTRRNTSNNEKVYEYTLYAAPDGVDPLKEEGYQKLAHTVVSDINIARYTERFDTATYRYFKLVIERAQSDFTVLAELYAGIRTDLNETVRPKNFEKNNVGFEENSANGKLTAKSVGSEYEFSFLGTGFDIFADTATNYGNEKVYVDGVEAGEIDLADRPLFNKRVFGLDGLSIAQHNVRIRVCEAPFNISFINVAYATPVEKKDYPAMDEEWGSGADLEFTTEWRTYVQDYDALTSIRFTSSVPAGYEDTLVRLSRYIRVYRMQGDANKIAFVYKGTIVSPMDASSLFAGCRKLRELAFENFDTSSMRNAVSMFNGCTALEALDLSGFDTHQTLYMGTMFEDCSTLRTLDLSGFEVKTGTNLVRIFDGCTALEKIVAPAQFTGNLDLAGNFVDHESKKFTRAITSENAGHVLTRHEDHTFVHYDAVDAGCETEGRKSYDLCPCGELRIDGATADEADLVLPATGHHWGEWHTVKEPTETEEGLEARDCTGGHSETRSIAKLVPAKGKGSNVGLIAGVAGGAAAVAIAGVVVAIVLSKKRKRIK